MTSISSETGRARSTDNADTSDSSWQLPKTQTAKGETLKTNGTSVENDISEKEPAKSDLIDDAIAAHNKRISLEDERSRKSDLSVKAQRLCLVADDILGSMSEAERATIQLYEYVKVQHKVQKPLYQWAKFDGYRAVNRALTNLDGAVAKFEEVRLPAAFAETYLSRATRISTAVSKVVVFVMGVMSEKLLRCMEEVEESPLSAEGKASAQARITEELRKLLKHCARATERVYAAVDLLRNSLHFDESNRNPDTAIIKELIAQSEARFNASRTSWLWTAGKVMLGGATSAVVALTAAHLYSTSAFGLALQADPNSTHSQIMSLVQRIQAVTNLTGEIYSITLEDLGQRYKELENASESHGLRIDNLVEALGVPNEDGTYFSSTPKPDAPPEIDCHTKDDCHSVPKAMTDANRQYERLRSELVRMRKNVHRMDIRLMKRLDKLDRRGL